MFVDEVDIHVAAGRGGRGCLAFRREKFVPRGGPSGGDGGHGGSVFVVANPHTNTLINYRFHPEFSAARGDHGQGSNRTGHTGADLELDVPPGTFVYERTDDRSFVLADVPGLIEGAHRGLGLGHQFLRHLERTKVLVHLVDVSSATGRDPVDDLDTVRRELELFQPSLASKPQLVAANKMDGVDDQSRVSALARRASALTLRFLR